MLVYTLNKFYNIGVTCFYTASLLSPRMHKKWRNFLWYLIDFCLDESDNGFQQEEEEPAPQTKQADTHKGAPSSNESEKHMDVPVKEGIHILALFSYGHSIFEKGSN